MRGKFVGTIETRLTERSAAFKFLLVDVISMTNASAARRKKTKGISREKMHLEQGNFPGQVSSGEPRRH